MGQRVTLSFQSSTRSLAPNIVLQVRVSFRHFSPIRLKSIKGPPQNPSTFLLPHFILLLTEDYRDQRRRLGLPWTRWSVLLSGGVSLSDTSHRANPPPSPRGSAPSLCTDEVLTVNACLTPKP